MNVFLTVVHLLLWRDRYVQKKNFIEKTLFHFWECKRLALSAKVNPEGRDWRQLGETLSVRTKFLPLVENRVLSFLNEYEWIQVVYMVMPRDWRYIQHSSRSEKPETHNNTGSDAPITTVFIPSNSIYSFFIITNSFRITGTNNWRFWFTIATIYESK